MNESLRDHLRPVFYTWGQARWSGTARSYTDYGTRDLPRLLALGDAVEFQERALGASLSSRSLPRAPHRKSVLELALKRGKALVRTAELSDPF